MTSVIPTQDDFVAFIKEHGTDSPESFEKFGVIRVMKYYLENVMMDNDNTHSEFFKSEIKKILDNIKRSDWEKPCTVCGRDRRIEGYGSFNVHLCAICDMSGRMRQLR